MNEQERWELKIQQERELNKRRIGIDWEIIEKYRLDKFELMPGNKEAFYLACDFIHVTDKGISPCVAFKTDGGNGAKHHIKGAFGLLGLTQQGQRDLELVIIAVMKAGQHGLDVVFGDLQQQDLPLAVLALYLCAVCGLAVQNRGPRSLAAGPSRS